MNNNEKNSYVKNKITEAMLMLLKEKEIKDISVSEICLVGEVSRISFYRNYEDKDSVIRDYVLHTLLIWNNNQKADIIKATDDALGDIFGYITFNKEFYLLLKKRGLLHHLKFVLITIIGPKPEYDNTTAYTTAFIANGIYGWMEEWFARGMQESGDEMTELLKNRKL